MNIIDWVKNNRITTVLVSFIIILISAFFVNTPRYGFIGGMNSFDAMPMMGEMFNEKTSISPSQKIVTQDRKFVSESNISLLVKNVKDVEEQIQNKVTGLGGYIVNTSYINPDISSTGSVTLRIPTDKVQALKVFLAENSVRIVSENISGYDVTDQYTDTQSKLDTLYKTKVIFENILTKAVSVDEILRVQQSILSVQDQIDFLKGSMKYLDETSKTSLITVNLSTDELALPYSPANPWRPQTIFKNAVRSLTVFLRSVGSFAIWAGVYSVVYIPMYVGYKVFKRRRRSKIN